MESPSYRLHAIRAVYTASSASEKLALLAALRQQCPRRSREVVRYHDSLLFLKAFPDDPRVLGAAVDSLRDFDRVTAPVTKAGHGLHDTGIAGTSTFLTCSYPVAKWLVHAFPGEAEVEWPLLENMDALDDLLRLGLMPAETDAFDSGAISTRQWMKLAKGSYQGTSLEWLLAALNESGAAGRRIADQYEAVQLTIRWNLKKSPGAISRNALRPSRARFRTGMRQGPVSATAMISKRLPGIKLLPPPRAREVIRVSRAALAARCREVDAISLANEGEVYWADLGEGVALALMGTPPALRLTLEANYGYVIYANGVPLGYGGVTPLYRQANTGINVFDTFRGSEIPHIWIQILRTFRTLFDVRRFVINGYQFGEGNPEAIRSGAFWFYYRLGFRPADEAARRLAAKAFRTIREHGKRVPESTLKKLAHGDLYLDLPGFQSGRFFHEGWLAECGRLVAMRLASAGIAKRVAATRCVSREVAARLGIHNMGTWPATERRAFVQLAPVVSLIPGIETWNRSLQRSLVDLMRAKGRPQEREFAQAARQHARFFPALIRSLRRPG